MGSSRKRGGELPEELLCVLPEFFRQTGCEDWETMRSPLPRRDCTVYFLRSRQFRLPELILKIYRKEKAGKNLARNLHAKSLLIHHSATSESTIPEPILCVPEENALAMAYIDAPIYGSQLQRGLHSKQTREEITRKAAQWLSWFHGLSSVAPTPLDAFAAFENISKTVGKIQNLDPHVLSRNDFLNECVEFAEKITSEIHGSPILHAVSHGDFTPFNLFNQGARTVGFDYQVRHRHPVTHDICRFLLYLEVSQIIPTRPSELRTHGCRADDVEIFMDAYGAGQQLLESGFWLRLQFLEITRRIASLSLPRASTWNRPFRLLELGVLRRNAGHILKTLK